ncbi:mycelial catalase cat1 [Moniliophthora roreri MCA 2997]|uniref:Catalase n=2 Tax=Moniliophthora roreri TaxID=221103 RepID=V2X9E0_MONRO|nr:mycelial catalase cat1 [Moniliophthora roreri MCA 2997]KAI3595092.1 mycelial catalase cat1 [Moniliophthora roreri]
MRNIFSLIVTAAVLSSAQCPYGSGSPSSLSRRATGDDGFLDQFVVDDSDSYTTTDTGTPVDDTHSLKAGARGPTLLEDFVLRTKITRFDHERIPERAVHARGAAAHGYFESYGDWSNLTAASFLSQAGKQTPIFLRFSTVTGSRGSSDTARDVHGYALRFYTDEGNYDIVGNNVPVFFIQDAIQFPDLIHSVKPRADNEIPQAATAHDSAYDFFSQNPSTLHTLLWALSGHGIPRSYRHVDGFGVHTFRFVTRQGESKLIKWHFKSLQGRASLVWPEALALAGQNPDFHRQDLFNAIAAGQYPEWEVGVQIVDEEDALAYGFDMLDPTKILPETTVPVTPLGKFVLNRNPLNYFAEVEQAMFSPGHVVPGIDFSDDPLLQGRLFSYVDTQLNRNMGSPNFEQIPINRPRNGFHNNNRDGAGQQFINSNINPYTFNTLNNGYPKPANQTVGNGFFSAPARRIVDAQYVREVSPTFIDYWSQPRLFYNSILPEERQMVINALRFELSHVQSPAVKANFVNQINKIDNDFAVRVALAINVEAPSPDPQYYHDNTTINLSIFNTTLPTLAGLNVGILTTTSTNSSSSLEQATSIAQSLASSGVNGLVIAETLSAGVDTTYISSDAVLFDGIIVCDGTEALFSASASTSPLYPPQRPMNIVRDAYYYGKPIAGIGAATQAFTSFATGSQPGVYMTNSTDGDLSGWMGQFEDGLRQFKFLDRFPMDEGSQ